MQLVGVCRFSLLGPGDWKAYSGKSAAEAEEITAGRAAELFRPERMEMRFATFEHLTLASISGQTRTQDLLLIVLASQDMPEPYRRRLDALCANVPQVVLRYFPAIDAQTAQLAVWQELGLEMSDVLQFRLDDDDCLCAQYSEVMHHFSAPLVRSKRVFAASLTGVMYSVSTGANAGVYYWPAKFLGVGVALRHHRRSIFRYGHYAMANRFPSLSIPNHMALVTHNGTNDTDFPNPGRIKKRGIVRMQPEDVENARSKFFPFLQDTGIRVSGIGAALEQLPEAPAPAET